MGPKHNLVHFKSLLWCLLIKSWFSSQHLYGGKTWRVIPSLPSHLVFHFSLVKWFRFCWQDWWGHSGISLIDYVIVIKNFLNPKDHQNPINGSKVTAILLKGWISPLGEASAVEGLQSTVLPRLVSNKLRPPAAAPASASNTCHHTWRHWGCISPVPCSSHWWTWSGKRACKLWRLFSAWLHKFKW